MATVLEIDARADTAGAAGDLASLGDEARNLGGQLDAAGGSARSAGADLSGLGEGSDALASKSSQATGALGALAGGLEAVGLDKYAGALQGAAIATDVASGAGDALNLVAETAAGRWVVTTARTVAHTVATGAQAVATGAMTVAQGALNAVMSLNPAAIVVITILALVAGIILAYKNSETFREIVQRVFEAAKGYVSLYVDAIGIVIDIVKSLPDIATQAWNAVSDAVRDAVDKATRFVTDLYDAVTGGIDNVTNTVSAGFEAAFAPIQTAIEWVQDLIDKIASIDFPDIPDLNPFGRTALPTTKEEVLAAGRGLPVSLSLSAAPQDRDRSIATMVDALRDYFARQGMTLSLTESPA